MTRMIGAADALVPDKTVPLPDVKGRIDHLAVDLKTKRVFVAALGNNTVEVADLAKGERVQTISGLDEPQGVAFLPDLQMLVVANGGDGRCCFFDGTTLKLVFEIKLKGDADNVRFDAKAVRVHVGFSDGALAEIDPVARKVTAEVRLGAHPESFQLETGGTRVFANVPGCKQVEVVDRSKREVTATWPLRLARSNFPMALDEDSHRLFAGCRAPAKVVVIDTESGKERVSFDCPGDVDDLFFDAKRKRLYVIGGEGLVSVFSREDADHFRLIQSLKTASGARTGLFVSEWDLLLVAVPVHGGTSAELRAFKVQ